ncbi:hypothetical protein TVAG_424510 [Trichomonas vaginalis G3]|uniref:DUF3447 domain-containing protein n=1 Tax=Trichomonas vaginalis (strain ATCC PRA-98 / G3) TaxID=412133 RepID=A2E1U0_TRIV3|nr:hypothetical protein TVAG_424510 [Trichomonas vaginalis G3]|eukprot:XP_001325642.1 hypothetical protein [Trichomonas vaginalis G3]
MSIFNELMEIGKDYNDLSNAIFKLRTMDCDVTKQIYIKCREIIFKTKNHFSSRILMMLNTAARYNNRYIKAYCDIFRKIYIEFQPNLNKSFSDLFDCITYEEYYKKDPFDFLQENEIIKAIMEDDKEKLKTIIDGDNFDKNQTIKSRFFPNPEDGLSLIELCCYYGSIECFMLLRKELATPITPLCLQFSIMNGNTYIMTESLKEQKPDEECMKYAIISHNIDMINFLQKGYEVEIKIQDCNDYHNYEVFSIYLDQTKNFESSLVYSTNFPISSLCEYLISHGANVNETDATKNTSLHHAATYNCEGIAEILIMNGAKIEARNNCDETPLMYASLADSVEVAKLLISHGANKNAVDKIRENSLMKAATAKAKNVVVFWRHAGI